MLLVLGLIILTARLFNHPGPHHPGGNNLKNENIKKREIERGETGGFEFRNLEPGFGFSAKFGFQGNTLALFPRAASGDPGNRVNGATG